MTKLFIEAPDTDKNGRIVLFGLDGESYYGGYFNPVQGPNILYAGVSADGAVDFEAPFHVSGGALVVLNAELDPLDPAPQPSGPDLPSEAAPSGSDAWKGKGKGKGKSEGARVLQRDRSWMHPPPINPANLDALWAFREATRPR